MTTREDPYVNLLNDIERVAEKYGYKITCSCNYFDDEFPRVEIILVEGEQNESSN